MNITRCRSGTGVSPGPEIYPPVRLELRHTFEFPREEVFDAWTNPAALVSWFGRPREAVSATVDLRIGGGYRLAIAAEEQIVTVRGLYLEVDPPQRLVYTWRWEVDGYPESVVAVEFHDLGGKTEVLLTQQRI
jgi:uncharacterized protein YndB with AHSA1/START domain